MARRWSRGWSKDGNSWRQLNKFESSFKNYAETKTSWRRRFSVNDGKLATLKVCRIEMLYYYQSQLSTFAGERHGVDQPVVKVESLSLSFSGQRHGCSDHRRNGVEYYQGVRISLLVVLGDIQTTGFHLSMLRDISPGLVELSLVR